MSAFSDKTLLEPVREEVGNRGLELAADTCVVQVGRRRFARVALA